ncbi:MAG TPA: TonB family protein [Burkholderiaceae bacterium]|nr:TonB family protein [Burkholderiaceae bacterium]
MSAQAAVRTPPPDSGGRTAAGCLPRGYRLREFEIESVLGEGGFGVVYSALDSRLERRVAIKEYMPTALATRDDDLSVQMRSSAPLRDAFQAGLRSFVNEAKLLARFEHPALVKVHQFWEEKGTAYMVMPYYPEPTLRVWIRSQRQAPDEVWVRTFLAAAMDAVETLHQGQCLHRDIAPDNMLVIDGSKPLLLDFGAARRVIGDLTQALTVVLKPGFAPVEQYADTDSMKQGPWTDVYGLAAVAYFMVTGKAPVPAVSRMLADDLVPAKRAAQGRYSDTLLDAIDAGLAVRPFNRIQSIAELRQRLAGVRADEEQFAETVLMVDALLPAGDETTAPAPTRPAAPTTPGAATTLTRRVAPQTLAPARRTAAPATRAPATSSQGGVPADMLHDDDRTGDDPALWGTISPLTSMPVPTVAISRRVIPLAGARVMTNPSRPATLPPVLPDTGAAWPAGPRAAEPERAAAPSPRKESADATLVTPAPHEVAAGKSTVPHLPRPTPQTAAPQSPRGAKESTVPPWLREAKASETGATLPRPAKTKAPATVIPATPPAPPASRLSRFALVGIAGVVVGVLAGAAWMLTRTTNSEPAAAVVDVDVQPVPQPISRPETSVVALVDANAQSAPAAAAGASPAPAPATPALATIDTSKGATAAANKSASSAARPASVRPASNKDAARRDAQRTDSARVTPAAPTAAAAAKPTAVAAATPAGGGQRITLNVSGSVTPAPAAAAAATPAPGVAATGRPVAFGDLTDPSYAPGAAEFVAPAPASEAPAPLPELRAIEQPKPQFPRDAARAGVAEGRIVARLHVNAAGAVTDVQILESRPPRTFDSEVRRALSQWRYEPPGQPRQTAVELVFRLE